VWFSLDANTKEIYWLSGIQNKYNRKTSTLVLCRYAIVRAQQENKGSTINNKQTRSKLTMTLKENNQTLYTTSTDGSAIPMVRALQQQLVLVVELQPQKEF
jgi:hypothetical protein